MRRVDGGESRIPVDVGTANAEVRGKSDFKFQISDFKFNNKDNGGVHGTH